MDYMISEAQTEGSQGDIEHSGQKMARVSEWGSLWSFCWIIVVFVIFT